VVNDIVNNFLLFLLGIVIILGARRLEAWDRHRLKRVRPWLSKYMPYSDETGLPAIMLRSKTGNPETWLFRTVGIVICIWAVHNLIKVLL